MSQVKHINVEQLKALTDKDKVQVVDIRDPQSYAANHIDASQHLTNENIADFMREADLDATTVVVCYHGISSVSAAEYLISQGFEDVYSLDGGFEAWSQSSTQ
ncbi:thiosulfate sulfurtransferase GlpE [Shewanella sp. OPT22]|nr:thiosulfate sulfurtransferase GlpE [Shewanella sp. OPT22]